MNMADLTPLALALIALLAALACVVIVPWAHAKFDAEEMERFLRWVEIGVMAAEQIFAATDGAAKKNYVLQFLKSKGYTANMEEIENAIEAAVLMLHKELRGGKTDAEQP